MSIKIVIIDDHKILIDAFMDHFKPIKDFEVIGYALSGLEAIELLHPEEKNVTPDVVLQDVDLEDMTGIECAEALLKLKPDLKILGVSSYSESALVKKLIKVGAKGYISKANDIENLEKAIRTVYDGENYIGELISKSLVEEGLDYNQRKSLKPSISGRELDVLRLIAKGMNTDEIADELCISRNTVSTHRKNLLLKFDVKNSVGLVLKAMEFEIIDKV